MKQEVLLLIIVFLECGGYALNCIYETNGIDSNHQMKKINCPANESSCIQDNFSTVLFL